MWRSISPCQSYSKQAISGFAFTYSIFLAHGMEQKSGGTGLIGSREFGILQSLVYNIYKSKYFPFLNSRVQKITTNSQYDVWLKGNMKLIIYLFFENQVN